MCILLFLILSSILSPLLVEYDKLIDSQQQEIRLYKVGSLLSKQ